MMVGSVLWLSCLYSYNCTIGYLRSMIKVISDRPGKRITLPLQYHSSGTCRNKDHALPNFLFCSRRNFIFCWTIVLNFSIPMDSVEISTPYRSMLSDVRDTHIPVRFLVPNESHRHAHISSSESSNSTSDSGSCLIGI